MNTPKEKLWMEYIRQNPAFAGPGHVTMSAAGVRKFFDKTYDAAREEGCRDGRATESKLSEQRMANSRWLADKFFGGRKET